MRRVRAHALLLFVFRWVRDQEAPQATSRPVRESPPSMDDPGLLLGLYAERADAENAIGRVRAIGYRRVSLIRRRTDGSVVRDDRYAALRVRLPAACAAVALVAASLLVDRLLPTRAMDAVSLVLSAGAVGGVLGWAWTRRYRVRREGTALGDLSRWLLPDDTALVVQADPADLDRALEAMRRAAERPPAVFVLLPALPWPVKESEPPAAPLSGGQLAELAHSMAETHVVSPSRASGEPLLDELSHAETVLETVRQRLADAARLEERMSVSAEWLLDNAYVVRGHIAEVRRNLAASFYHELPVLEGQAAAADLPAERSGAVPRVYVLAQAIVEHVGALIDGSVVEAFLESYQQDHVLTIGELWAVPLMLRVALVRRLEELAIETELRLRDRALADLCANRLLVAARRDPTELFAVLAQLARVVPQPTAYFSVQLIGHLYDEDDARAPVQTWLERKLKSQLADVIVREQAREATEQVSIGSTITSLRRLSQMDWTEVFERLSRVEQTLRRDPSGAYAAMDFDTRDRYRDVVEQLARASNADEDSVAQAVVDLASEAPDDELLPYSRSRHVGSFLVGSQRAALPRQRGLVLPRTIRVRAFVGRHHTPLYLGAIALLTAIVLVPVVKLGTHYLYDQGVLALALVAALPASALAVEVVNYLVVQIMPPRVLPKMWFAEDGIPDAFRTLVVVPTILVDEEAARLEVQKLETRYLANPDSNLLYALLGDYADADQRQLDGDAGVLRAAVTAMEELDRRYGPGRFFCLHRDRDWSPSEERYIGWERKRGKLLELCALIAGQPIRKGRAIVRMGDPDLLSDVRYVITLDSDTQLPRNSARRLVETMAHPLNQPHEPQAESGVSPDGRGFVIVQPRVSTSLPSATATPFSRLFSSAEGTDPYTRAVSDVYQDLAGEATYYGKGILEPRAFLRQTAQRFPEERILSHDLIEGAHVGVGLASDIELLDEFPPDYASFARREHRWMRGDWQIAEWCLPWIRRPAGGWKRNDLSVLDRWKVFDNLRRSLVPASSVAFLVASWAVSWHAALLAFAIVALGKLIMPTALLAGAVRLAGPRLSRRDVNRQVARAAVDLVLLPHQAVLALDAVGRVAYRRLVSHHGLLEWVTAQHAHRFGSRGLERLTVGMWLVALVSAGITLVLARLDPLRLLAAAPVLVLWLAAPAVVDRLVARPALPSPASLLSEDERRYLRGVACRTWRFFEDFVGPDTRWLPPDNYQVSHQDRLAMRTSPTNIAMWLLAGLSALDLGYLTPTEAAKRLAATFETIGKLQRHEGHLLNWYELPTLRPLPPRYVSFVDSGNLLAALWTLDAGLASLVESPPDARRALRGLGDTARVLREELVRATAGRSFLNLVDQVLELADSPPDAPLEARSRLEEASELAARLHGRLGQEPKGGEAEYWSARLENRAVAWRLELLRAAAVPGRTGSGNGEVASPGADVTSQSGGASSPGADLTAPGTPAPSPSVGVTLEGPWSELASRVADLRRRVHDLAEACDMRFLYDRERRLFAVGFNVDEGKLDASCYDLFASEARLGSFLAIARGDVPVEHWLSMARPYRQLGRERALLSWSGSMFEYLMPGLVQRTYPNSLLDAAIRDAVEVQRRYAAARNIPWGISEAAYGDLDAGRTYQYRAFGVPDLGLQRGLGSDLVVAPYATFLALEQVPVAALRNLRRLESLGMRDAYGFFESVDFRRQRRRGGERGVLVRTYMAHHQGMSLAAIVNALDEGAIRQRFHHDARVVATESLLYERVPVDPPLLRVDESEHVRVGVATEAVAASVSRFDTPHTDTVKTQLLSNGRYSVMITGSGGGYSRWNEVDLTRWRADPTCDPWGMFCYVLDRDSDALWSVGHNPTQIDAERYEVLFALDRAEIRRLDNGIESDTTVVVSPEDDVEIRRVTLINRSGHRRRMALTSYVELALAQHRADRQHPAFNKLFVHTEALEDQRVLVAHRRPRFEGEAPIWVAHRVTVEGGTRATWTSESDRGRFVGAGGSLADPVGAHEPLVGLHGFTLDPALSWRRAFTLGPGQRTTFSMILGAAASREGVLDLMNKYEHIPAVERALELAWVHAQLELRQLRVQPDEARRFQQLAGYMLYSSARLRPPPDRLEQNRLGQPALWAYGISGDLPIAVVTICDERDIGLVRQLLQAHAYWRQHGLKADLVVLNEESSGYSQSLQAHLARLVQGHVVQTGVEQPGGVFLRSVDQLRPDDLNVLLASASVALVAARGNLARQLGVAWEGGEPTEALAARPVQREPARALPHVPLKCESGFGGFAADGHEYVVQVDSRHRPPAPWVNIMANAEFGTLVSESGAGFTWSMNSQRNRLTPWSNDALLDPPSEVTYVRDEATGEYWTLTRAPVEDPGPYRVRHAAGYSVFAHNGHDIEGEMTVYVPVDGGGQPVRVSLVRLRNAGRQSRRLTVTFYAALVLGETPEESAMHVQTYWDQGLGALLARNRYRAEFGERVAFAAAVGGHVRSYTGDRTEFLGRNGSLRSPQAMRQKELAGRVGPALDPCAALQVELELAPGQTGTVVGLLGQAASVNDLRDLLLEYRDERDAVDKLELTRAWWERLLDNVTVALPEAHSGTAFLLNHWLPYQVLSARMWARTGLYQPSGAFGFRDQLQDALALLYAAPEVARQHILRAARRQFPEGDVQHWWHLPGGTGVRTRISDDMLWLPYAVAQYVAVTGDRAVLDELVPFVTGRTLEATEPEAYFTPTETVEHASLYDHCLRAIQRASTAGPHGLPLMGTGDWNDGLNRVGPKGRGESVWLGWFLVAVLNDFAASCVAHRERTRAAAFRRQAGALAARIEESAWDGRWYLRAWFDDGLPLGSAASPEAQIDSLPQSWAWLAGAPNQERASQALDSAWERLVRPDEGLVLLLTPPFDAWAVDPGYLGAYPPGIRENGGQYTHAAMWLALAAARAGQGRRAVDLLELAGPIWHSRTKEVASRYRVEPYVAAADVYGHPASAGRGGWTWYTGAAAWMYRAWLEGVLGVCLRGDRLRVDPAIPPDWPGFQVRIRRGSALYEVSVENPNGVESGVESVELDGRLLPDGVVPVVDDGARHSVTVQMGRARPPAG